MLQRRPTETVRLISVLGGASLIALLACLINANYKCSKRGSYGLAVASITLIAAIVLLLIDRFKPHVLHAEVA